MNDLLEGADPFDGVAAYAQAKRAQVNLVHEFSRRFGHYGVTFSSMHPGWVDTGGVQRSLPKFYKMTRRLLRTPEQGADTVAWLATSPDASDASGRFYFDRLPRREHLPLRRTRSSDEELAALWKLCEEATGTGRLRAVGQL